jgi:hypothetical protein
MCSPSTNDGVDDALEEGAGMNLNSILIGSENPLQAAGATVVRGPYEPGGGPRC